MPLPLPNILQPQVVPQQNFIPDSLQAHPQVRREKYYGEEKGYGKEEYGYGKGKEEYGYGKGKEEYGYGKEKGEF
jgi:hypothetical protein